MPIEQQSADAVKRAMAFAGGLRKSLTITGKRWTPWPGGERQLSTVIARIDDVVRRLHDATGSENGATEIAACISDLRALLEWTTYQSAALATARAVTISRRTRTVVAHLRLVEQPDVRLSLLTDSEAPLLENVRTRNGYMRQLAERYAHLELPEPLVDPAQLPPIRKKTPGRLALIRQLTEGARSRAGGR